MKAITAHCRPHLMGEACWCKPHVEECEGCGEQHWYHRQLELAPDAQPRMAVFSDQTFSVEPSIGVTF